MGALPGSGGLDVDRHARLLVDREIQHDFSRRYLNFIRVYNLTRDDVANDFVHAFDREIPSYASGAGTTFKPGVTGRF